MTSREPLEVPAAAAFHPDAATKARCAEYEQRFAAALEADPDPRLDEVSLLQIAPHPDARSVLVVVVGPPERHAEIDAALEEAKPRFQRALRREGEGSGPELAFALMAPASESS